MSNSRYATRVPQAVTYLREQATYPPTVTFVLLDPVAKNIRKGGDENSRRTQFTFTRPKKAQQKGAGTRIKYNVAPLVAVTVNVRVSEQASSVIPAATGS